MTAVLIRKLLRDIRVALVMVCLLLGAFQCLWARVTERILGQLAPFLHTLAGFGGLDARKVEDVVFEGPGKIVRTLIGGETVTLDRAMDLMTIGFVHPLIQIIFCIWAIGRAAGAIAGELDRGTMELLLAQPLARFRVILAHLCVDCVTIPILCLSMWAGTILGTWMVSPIQIHTEEIIKKLPRDSIIARMVEKSASANPELLRERLHVNPWEFGRALWLVGGLLFAVSGFTLWLSALGRYRFRVLGLAVFLMLLQFLVNLIGQMWDVMAPLRPLTVFYYYQPQQVILAGDWYVKLREWNSGQDLCQVPMVGVLLGVGAIGYALALWTFTRRDLPAPL